MNILLPIITNSLLAIFLLIGMVMGRKNGKLAILKTLLFAGALVGCYFLTPVLLVEGSGLINVALSNIGISLESSLAFSVILSILSLLSYLTVSLFIKLIKKPKRVKSPEEVRRANRAKVRKIKNAKNVKSERTKRARARIKKARTAKIVKPNKFIGGLFSFITMVLLSFTLFLPFKYAIETIVESQPELEQIQSMVEYTPFEQLDNIWHFIDIVID